jgi:hypothetical protein
MRTRRHAGHIATAARPSRVGELLGPRCLSLKELRGCNYDSGDESQCARKQQKVDREPGHDTLPTLIQAASSHRELRPLLQGGRRAAAACRNWGSGPRSGVAGAFEKEGRELPSPHGLTLAPRPMDTRIWRADVAGCSAESCCHCGDHCVGCDEPVSRLRRLMGESVVSPTRSPPPLAQTPHKKGRGDTSPPSPIDPPSPQVRGLILSGGAVEACAGTVRAESSPGDRVVIGWAP